MASVRHCFGGGRLGRFMELHGRLAAVFTQGLPDRVRGQVSGHLDLGAVRAVGTQAIKKIIPREFPLLKPLGWRLKRQKSIDLDLGSARKKYGWKILI